MSDHAPNLDTVTTIRADGSRRFLHPAVSRGPYTRMRAWVGTVLLSIYFALPWIQINGAPAVFLDIAARQFHLFGLTFFAQDLWLLFFLITGVGFLLFYTTALLGRIWCGWACPQTVILDFARRIERWIEGDHLARRQMDKQPATFGRSVRRGAKNLVMAGFAFLLAHAWLSYFVSIPGLYQMMHASPGEHWAAFCFVFLLTGALWFNLAWFREQFCIVLCPYGRLQSALMDSNSLVIGYDASRGEPRSKRSSAFADPSMRQRGDCIDCRRCVEVCPTGIDIRQGLQLECIGCAACVDACAEVMQKLHRPAGLIRYDSLNGFAGKATRWIRPRIVLYSVLLLVGSSALCAALSTLRPVTMVLGRVRGAPYVLENDLVRNQFLVRILNKRSESIQLRLELPGIPAGLQMAGFHEPVTLPPLGEALRPLVVFLPQAEFTQEFLLTLRLVAIDGRTILERTLPFAGPVSYTDP
jgi:cytochrome c oxidase accessory protein FixG